MRTAVVLIDPTSLRSTTVGAALAAGLTKRGWTVVKAGSLPNTEPDLIAGYGWGKTIRNAFSKWPDILLHVDLGWWSRKPPGAVLSGYHKIVLGGRWPVLDPLDQTYRDDRRLRIHDVVLHPPRLPGKRVLVAGMSGKAAGTFGLEPEAWETRAICDLRRVGAVVLYRPKPSWSGARPLEGAGYHNPGFALEDALSHVDGVVTHHGNVAVDAIAAGLPIYVEVGVAKQFSVGYIEEVVRAEAVDIVARAWLLREVSWHQWSIAELASGTWLEEPAPLARRLG